MIEARADLGVLDVNRRRRSAHGDGLLQRCELHRAVHSNRLPDGHDDTVAHERSESRELERQLVRARVDGREAIDASSARGGCRSAHHRGPRQRDGDARQHAALVIDDFADDLAERLARLRGSRCHGDRDQQRDRGSNSKKRTYHR